MLKEPAGEVMDDFLIQVWQTGLAHGHSEQDLDPLMRKIRDLWRYYMTSRYPHAEIDWEEGLKGMVDWGQKYKEELAEWPKDYTLRA